MSKSLSVREFAFLMAMLTAMSALAIDAMLPALAEIGSDLGVERENNRQLVLTAVFVGFGLGQIAYGPLSDYFGRKPSMYIGLGLFVFGCLLSLAAWSYPVMLAGRFLQGVGAAGPRIVCLALIRDRYKGREMARIMSYVFLAFIIVPTVAPALGQLILLVSGWRMIFGAIAAFAFACLIWFAARQPETLTPERRVPLAIGPIAAALREIAGNRPAVGYTVTSGLVFGGFLGFLNSAQQIFQVQFQVGTLFPAYFAALALAFAASTYLNGRLVLRLGMRTLSAARYAHAWCAACRRWAFCRPYSSRSSLRRRGCRPCGCSCRGAAQRFSASAPSSATSTRWPWNRSDISRASQPP